MHKYVIADTSVFIIFDKINQLDLLREIYQTVYTTPEIAKEYNKTLPDWILIRSPFDKKYQDFINTLLDTGEASAIALAIEHDNALLILDDFKARKLSKTLSLNFTGTLGVLNKAKSLGLISKLKPILDALQKTNFRVSEKIINELLLRNGE